MAKEVVYYNGKKMPIVGLGTNQIPDDEVGPTIDAALEAGYRHIDTAYFYKNEAAIGKALKRWFDSGKIRREELFITTKLPIIGIRKESVEKYLRASLKALQLEYVDLYLVHSPVGLLEKGEELIPRDENGKVMLDLTTDIISVWKKMEEQVDAGRAKTIGISNFNSSQIKRIVKCARIQPVNLQIELHPYFQQRELSAFCKALDITVTAYSSFKSPGYAEFFKKSGRDMSTSTLASLDDPMVQKIAKIHNKSPAQVILRHIIQRGIVVIPKSTNPIRIRENFEVFDFELTNEEVHELDLLDQKQRIINPLAYEFLDHHEYPFSDPY